MIKQYIILFILFIFPSICFPANLYVRDGATGNCTVGWDVSDACDQISTAETAASRGDTIYVADGSYTGFTLNTVASGSTVITIKKATDDDYGSGTNWSSAYGDGVAAITSGVSISTSYWTIDGVVGGGPTSWASGHGISIYSTSNILITLSGTVSDINLSHIKMYSDRGSTFIAGIKGTTGAYDNIKVAYCELSNIFGAIFHIYNWTNSTIEYSYLYANKSTAEWHSEGISSIGTNENIVIRYNLWDSIEGTAVFAGVNAGSSVNWQIYGNVFSRSETTIYYYWENPGTNQNSMSNSEFFNNTIIGINGISQGGLIVQNGENNIAYNNIWYDNDANAFGISFTHDYSYADLNVRTEGCTPACDKDPDVISGEANGWKDGGDPFESYGVDPLVADLTPSSGFFDSNPGFDTGGLVSGNDVDMNGVTRGSDGTWDMGAIEYGTAPENAIQGLTISNLQTIEDLISWNRSDGLR